MSIALMESKKQNLLVSRLLDLWNKTPWKRIFGFTLLGFGCVFVGLITVFLPMIFILGLVGTAIFVWLTWCFPWLGLGLYMVVLLVSPDLKISDVVSAASLSLIGFRLTLQGAWQRFPTRQLWPYLAFALLLFLSVVTGLIVFHNETPFVYRDGRVLLYWLWFPMLYTLAATDAKGEEKLGRLLAFLAALIACLALFQYGTGIQIVAEGRVGALETMGSLDQSSTRVQMPGFYFVSFLLVWLTLAANFGTKRVLFLLPAIGGLALALYANFGRGLWIWTLVAVLLSSLFIGPRRAIRFLAMIVVAFMVGGVTLYAVRPSAVEAIATRVESISDEGGARTSYGWRKLENEDALNNIKRSPIVGIGMGGEYRRWMGEVSVFKEHTRYLHHSYLYIALKVGVPAILALLCFFAVAWRHGYRKFVQRQQEGTPDARLIAALCSLPAIMALSVTQPEFMNAFGAIFYSLMTALLLLPLSKAGKATTSHG